MSRTNKDILKYKMKDNIVSYNIHVSSQFSVVGGPMCHLGSSGNHESLLSTMSVMC